MYLLDTNILSPLVSKEIPAPLIHAFRRNSRVTLYTSCICVMEMRHGAQRRMDGGILWRRIQSEILSQVQILDVGLEEATTAGDILAHLGRAGRPVEAQDALIAATALVHEFVLVTHNVRHFERIIGITIEDWLG